MSGNSGAGREAQIRGTGGMEWHCILWDSIKVSLLPKVSQITQGCTWCGVLELPRKSHNYGFGQTTSQP